MGTLNEKHCGREGDPGVRDTSGAGSIPFCPAKGGGQAWEPPGGQVSRSLMQRMSEPQL